MINRFGDLGGWTAEGDDEEENAETFEDEHKAKNGDVEMAKPKHDNHIMEFFFKNVDSIKADIEAVKEASKTIDMINDQSLQATTTDEENELSRQLRPLIDSTNKAAKRTKTLLGLLKEETAKLQSEDKLKQSDLRIRENLCSTLTRKFIDEMKTYQNAQQKYKTDIKKKVARQVQVVKPDATDEEIDAVMRSEGGRDALYRETILAGGVNDQVQTTYAKVAGKYQDVLALEQSVAELHQLFLDFALLTEQQGELLDQIEFQVREAGDYVEDANVDIFQAIESQKAIRKKQLWIMGIVVAAICVLLLVLFV